MSKLIRLSDDIILLLDNNKGNKTYSDIIRELITNSNSKQIVNTTDKQIELILKELLLIKEEIRSMTNRY